MALDFFAGCVGGCAGVLVGHPLDTVKVHIQTQDLKNPKYKGTWHCMRSIVAQDRVSGLYRGITSPMVGVGFVNAIVFGIYGNIQRTRQDPNSLASHALAGGVAGLCQSIVCSPMELAKTRLQLQSETTMGTKFKGPLDCLRHIARHEGLRGTMKGLLFTAARDVPGFASYFVSYEYMMRQPLNTNVVYGLCAGGLAGIFSWVATYPLDVIKTCIQADDAKRPQYRGYMDCIRKGYESNGLRFFFRGMPSTMLRSFPMNAACFFVVSSIMNFSRRSEVSEVVYTTEQMALISLATPTTPSTPMCHMPHIDASAEEELRQRRSVMAQSLRSFGTFNEAVCHKEAEQLAYEFYPDKAPTYYMLEEDKILCSCEHFNDC